MYNIYEFLQHLSATLGNIKKNMIICVYNIFQQIRN